MKILYEDHIALYSNVYEDGFCQHLITEFETLATAGVGSDRQKNDQVPRHKKDDYSIFVDLRNHNMNLFNNMRPTDVFFDGLQKCYDEYTAKYSTLKDNGSIRATTMKMQKTSPGAGYHVWHAEQGPGPQSSRVVVYMLYLNTLQPEDGGETEFMHQRKRYRPVENTMVIWPASYTHAHRGNLVLGTQHKYVVTGWFYYD